MSLSTLYDSTLDKTFYCIYTSSDLIEFRDIVNGSNYHYQDLSANARLMNDITLNYGYNPKNENDRANCVSWLPIRYIDISSITDSSDIAAISTYISTSSKGYYTGIFDGNNYTISGLYINNTANGYYSLFGFAQAPCQIKNLNIDGYIYSSSNCTAGILSLMNENTTDSTLYSVVSNCINYCTIKSKGKYTGGIIGYSTGYNKILNCVNKGNISSTSTYIGGITGVHIQKSDNISNCVNEGNIYAMVSDSGTSNGLANVGGICGSLTNNYPVNCLNNGKIAGSSSVGAIIGNMTTTYSGTSTKCYYLNNTVYSNCQFSNGEISTSTANGYGIGSYNSTNATSNVYGITTYTAGNSYATTASIIKSKEITKTPSQLIQIYPEDYKASLTPNLVVTPTSSDTVSVSFIDGQYGKADCLDNKYCTISATVSGLLGETTQTLSDTDIFISFYYGDINVNKSSTIKKGILPKVNHNNKIVIPSFIVANIGGKIKKIWKYIKATVVKFDTPTTIYFTTESSKEEKLNTVFTPNNTINKTATYSTVGGNESLVTLNNNIATYKPVSINYYLSHCSQSIINLSTTLTTVGKEVSCWSPEKGLFCTLIQNSNIALTSPDGITWTEYSLPSSGNWVSICWSSRRKMFCAIDGTSNSSIAIISYDGLTWTNSPLLSASNWVSICWSPKVNRFLVISSTGKTLISRNGILWLESTNLPAGDGWASICWSQELGIFCAISSNSISAYSSNLTTWTSITLSISGLQNICWSPELKLFCAVGSTASYATSPDGITWTKRTLPSSITSPSIIWSSSLQLFIITKASYLSYSSNGIDWTNITLDYISGNIYCVAKLDSLISISVYSNNIKVLLFNSFNNNSVKLKTTATETGVNNTTDVNLYQLATSINNIIGYDTIYNASGYQYYQYLADILPNNTTNKKLNWSVYGGSLNVDENGIINTSHSVQYFISHNRQRTLPNSLNWSSVCWAEEADNGSGGTGLYCVIAKNSSVASTSPDGVNWTSRVLPSTSEWNLICWSPELKLFCIIAYNSTVCATSPDGITWTSHTLPVTAGWSSICWSPKLGVFCIISGDTSKTLTTSDFTTWNQGTLPLNGTGYYDWGSVCWAEEADNGSGGTGLYCAVVGSSNVAATSPDGITWTQRTLPENVNCYSVCWSSDLEIFCAISHNSNTAITSPDGITWTSYIINSIFNCYSICWSLDLGIFYAITKDDNKIMYSEDGETWEENTLSNNVINHTSICWSPKLMEFCISVSSTNVILVTRNNSTDAIIASTTDGSNLSISKDVDVTLLSSLS